jgi:hypothetical protein
LTKTIKIEEKRRGDQLKTHLNIMKPPDIRRLFYSARPFNPENKKAVPEYPATALPIF